MVNSDLKEHIEASVSKLPTKAQEVFRLYFFEDQPQKEIAEKLGISARTVASHVYSSVQFLREDLKDLLILYLAFLKVLN